MEFSLITLLYFGFKILFLLAHYEITHRLILKNQKEFLIFVFNPLPNRFIKNDKYLSLYYYVCLILTLAWAGIILSRISYLLDVIRINSSVGILYLAVLVIFVGFLMYLSLYDIMSFSLPVKVTKRLLLFSALVNILFLLYKMLWQNPENFYIFEVLGLGQVSNLVGALIGGLILLLIVKLTKQKSMGKGDVDIIISIGLIAGFPGILTSFFYTLITASTSAIIYIVLKRKYKNLLIPFAPFLATGFLLFLAFQDSIARLFY
jgi:prepilin signal peptidase PulO-like enzyme (type II secretory pathway)